MMISLCAACGDAEQYLARGLCHKCYERIIYRPKRRDWMRDYNKKYRQKNRKKLIAYQRQYYIQNHERFITQARQYRKDNKILVNERKVARYHNGHSDTVKIRNICGKKYWYHGNGKPVHRIIAEKVLGRKLKSHEIIHHIDENGPNNAHDNLIICTRSYHVLLHVKLNTYKKRGVA